MALVLAWTFSAYLDDSNLWPLLLIFASPVALVYVLAVGTGALLRRTPS